MNKTFSDRLTDTIIDYAKSFDVELSAKDVKDIGIYILHSIVTSVNSDLEKTVFKQGLTDIIGDENKIKEFLFITLNGICVADDAIADETYSANGGAE